MKLSKLLLPIFLCLLIFQGTLIFGQKSEILFLSGTGADNTVTWEFYCTDGMNSKEWKTIEVPSCWEQQGFGAYHYGHVPFEDRLKEEGIYKYEFNVPDHWKDLDVKIVFEGVMTDAAVKINGKSLGEVHQGAFYPFEYNINSVLNYDEINLLDVHVKKFSENMSVNYAERKADYWILSMLDSPLIPI